MGPSQHPRATTSAWDAMDRAATTRHTAPWAGWRRTGMERGIEGVLDELASNRLAALHDAASYV